VVMRTVLSAHVCRVWQVVVLMFQLGCGCCEKIHALHWSVETIGAAGTATAPAFAVGRQCA
jgi:hypothetical protein